MTATATAPAAATTPTTPPKLGPGKLAQPSAPGMPNFALSTPQWLTIQAYVNNALALPTTTQAFATSLGPGAPGDLSPFAPLIAAYAAMNSSCSTWQNTTYPNSVNLASDIYDYSQQVAVYYNAINELAQALNNNQQDTTSANNLKEAIGALSAKAAANQANANAVYQQIKTFADQTNASKSILCGANGNGGLIATYQQQYGTTSAAVQSLTQQLNADMIQLAYWNKQYAHDVVVAATSPTYSWIFPFGTIASAVVAGVYGHKAVEAADQASSYEQQINALNAQLAADANLLQATNTAELSLTTIATALSAALPVIETIEGEWGAISSDLSNIVSLIDTNISGVAPFLMGLGIQTAITEWTNVGNEANGYRLNAYVQVTN